MAIRLNNKDQEGFIVQGVKLHIKLPIHRNKPKYS